MEYEKLELKIFPTAIVESNLGKRNFIGDEIPDFEKVYNLARTLAHKTTNTDQYSLVSSATGKIKKIVFHFRKIQGIKNADAIGLHHVIRNLANLMCSEVDFIIVTDKVSDTKPLVAEAFLKTVLNSKFHKIFPLKDGSPYSYWASDPYKAVNFENKIMLVEPANLICREDCPGDAKIANYFVKNERDRANLEFTHKEEQSLRFDGGNILVGDDFVFVGEDIYQKNTTIKVEKVVEEIITGLVNKDTRSQQLLIWITQLLITEDKSEKLSNLLLQNIDAKELQDTLENDILNKENVKKALAVALCTNKKFSFIGRGYPKVPPSTPNDVTNFNAISNIKGEYQPMFHLDLFMTLAGRMDDAENKYHVVIGQPVSSISEEKLNVLDPSLKLFINEQVDAMSTSIDDVIKQLDQEKFKITRIPLPLTYYDFLDESEVSCRRWYWASYNNCLVEIDKKSGLKTVWFPSYCDNYSDKSIPLLDRNKEIWKKRLGKADIDYGNWTNLESFEKDVLDTWRRELHFNKVIPVKAHFNWYAQKNGSLACLINCVEREIYSKNSISN